MMTPFEAAARAHAESRGSSGTKDLYLADLARWLVHCELEAVDPAAPTRESATSFRNALAAQVYRGKKTSGSTVRRTITALSSMYDNALDSSGKPLVAWNPFKKLNRPPAVKFGLTEPITAGEVCAVITEAEKLNRDIGTRDAALMYLMYETGMRVSSAVAMERSTLFKRDDLLFMRTFGKGNKRIEVQIPQKAAEALERWLAVAPESMYVFPAGRGGGPLVTKAVNKRLKMYGDLAGVKKVNPHRFRAAYIVSALDAGVPLFEIQASVQHEDPKTTLRYDTKTRGLGVASAVAAFREKKIK